MHRYAVMGLLLFLYVIGIVWHDHEYFNTNNGVLVENCPIEDTTQVQLTCDNPGGTADAVAAHCDATATTQQLDFQQSLVQEGTQATQAGLDAVQDTSPILIGQSGTDPDINAAKARDDEVAALRAAVDTLATKVGVLEAR